MISIDNIVLVGPMGSGKSTVGKKLAQNLDMHFVDTDQSIEESLGVSIAWIFDKEGEAGFRIRETRILREVLEKSNQVIATGGGMVTIDENQQMLAIDNALVVYLKPQLAVLHRRLMHSRNRPLLENAQDRNEYITRLYEQRDPLYQQVASITYTGDDVPLNKQVEQLTATIHQCLNTAL